MYPYVLCAINMDIYDAVRPPDQIVYLKAKIKQNGNMFLFDTFPIACQ